MKSKKLFSGLYEVSKNGLTLEVVKDNGNGAKWGIDFPGDSWYECLKMDNNFMYGVFQGDTKTECMQIVNGILEQWTEYKNKC